MPSINYRQFRQNRVPSIEYLVQLQNCAAFHMQATSGTLFNSTSASDNAHSWPENVPSTDLVRVRYGITTKMNNISKGSSQRATDDIKVFHYQELHIHLTHFSKFPYGEYR
jgi:hypothetical protein